MGFERLTARSSITLPIGDRDWVIESPDAATGAYVNALVERGRAAKRKGRDLTEPDVEDLHLDDEEERNLYARLLGDTYEEMTDRAAGCSWEDVKLAALTTLFWVVHDLETAERFFNAGGVQDPPVAPTNRAGRRAAGKATAKSSPSRGSTAGTTRPRVIKGEVVSTGRPSSRTGP